MDERIRTGMTLAYRSSESDKPLLGVVQHIGLNAETQGIVWIRILDRVGNGVLITINLDQVIGIIIRSSAK
jgi:hypothetical protein